MSTYLALAIAIVSEVIATLSLKSSEGFSKLTPLIVVVLGYGCAFYFLSIALKTIPLGIAYAVWSGVGIVLISIIGWILFGQKLDAAALLGMALIVAGVIVVNVFSKTVSH